MRSLLAITVSTLAVSVNAALVPPGAFVQWAFSVVGPGGPCITATDTASGTPVQIQQCSAVTLDQRNWFVPQGSAASGTGPATQIKIFGDRCLDVKNGLNQNGNTLQIWACEDGNPNQLFNVNDQDLTISWNGHGKCLDLTGGNTASGTAVQIWACSGTNGNQKWFPTVNGAPVLQAPVNVPQHIQTFIVNSRFAPCLTASSNADGAAVILRNCNSGDSNGPIWTVVKGGAPEGAGAGPAGQIKVFGNKCLDVPSGVEGSNLQIWTCSEGNPNQQWQVNGDGSFSWAGHNQCIEVTNGGLADGNPIKIATCQTNSGYQAWNVVPTNIPPPS